VTLTVDADHLGPNEESWLKRIEFSELARLDAVHARRLIVVAPHPDDEVLGAGGLIQAALRDRVLVEFVAVTNGEASHPDSEVATTLDLAALREQESRTALRRLGVDDPVITRLQLPDGKIGEHRRELDDALSSLLLPDDLCVAPWRRDGHPDHNVCGDAAAAASRSMGCKFLEYMVWSWHWADPDGSDIPWDRCVRLDLDRRQRARKRWATGAFQSQINPIGTHREDAAILPEPILRRFWRPYEVLIDDTGACS
jgi:LmbE family N-acetylglucosaminyl deacetylase